MKPQDLMIGDWVIRKGVPNEPMRLYNMNASRGIAYLDQDGRGVAELYYKLAPIPLTPEILEKSGFEKVKYGCYIIGRTIEDYYFACFRGEELQIGIDTGAYETPIFATIHYVHELQHVLKLLNIEKDIII